MCERGPLAQLKHLNRVTLHLLYTSLCTGELNAIRKYECLLCSPFYVKSVSSGYVGLNQNLKDLKWRAERNPKA